MICSTFQVLHWGSEPSVVKTQRNVKLKFWSRQWGHQERLHRVLLICLWKDDIDFFRVRS